jgi:hypothetical protein
MEESPTKHERGRCAMSGQFVIAAKRRRKFAHPPKKSIPALLARSGLALLFICGLVYLANQTMLFGLDTFVR